MKKGKACGIDGIPVEVLNNTISVNFLCKLFNVCLDTGIFPSMWKIGVINPVPKTNMQDDKDPSSYRGITLAVSSYKLFCSIINNRLMEWEENENILMDEQNGFRKGRNCIDHIGSLVEVIDTRLKCKQNTYAAFIDF